MAASVPGDRQNLGAVPVTTVSYAGPPELRLDLPARTVEAARQQAREILSRTATAVASAEGDVARLAPGYPSSFDSTVAWLRSRNQVALASALAADAHAALARVREIAAEVAETAESLRLAARGISQRIQRVGRPGSALP